MEAFSLLNFWRNAADDPLSEDSDETPTYSPIVLPSTITRSQTLEETDGQTDDDDDDEESFFDLVFTASPPDCDSYKGEQINNCGSSVNINNFGTDDSLFINSNLNLSKPDGYHMTRSKFLESPTTSSNSSDTPSNSKPHSPISLLRSPPKFRFLMLGFSKSKLDRPTDPNSNMSTPMHNNNFQKSSSKRFAVKCKVEEVPIGSFFSRDNSLRNKLKKEGFEEEDYDASSSKRFPPKDVGRGVQKYLRLIKQPLYFMIPKRSSSGGENTTTTSTVRNQSPSVNPLSSPAPATVYSSKKQADEKSRSAFREVCRHLVKSRSATASSSVGIMPSSSVCRRDDSVQQQQEGIQGAILHCKRSYSSSSSSSSSQDCSLLSRSGSGPCREKSANSSSAKEDEKRISI